MRRSWFVLPAALLMDALLGDPPNRYHPVAWMGSVIGWLKRRAPQNNEPARFAYGGGIVLGGGTLVWWVGKLLEGLCLWLPGPLGVLVEALVLKMTVSANGLIRAGSEVHMALERQDIVEARRLLSWHLVSRDTSQLDESQVSAAAVESIAENFSDGVVAPIFYYLIGGLPAALAYRYSNTCDSMLGYHDPQHEWLGKIPARLDDALNLAPSRISALLILLGASACQLSWRRAVQIWRRDSGSTESPNAGHPMSAMAGGLGVELEKVGHYRLGAGGRKAQPTDIHTAIRVMRTGLMIGVGAACLSGLASRFWRSHDRA